jgi:hypothetical protein
VENIKFFNKQFHITPEKDQMTKACYWRGIAKIYMLQKESGCLDLRKAFERGYPDADLAIQKYCQ